MRLEGACRVRVLVTTDEQVVPGLKIALNDGGCTQAALQRVRRWRRPPISAA
jgi:hypothetical protein